MKFPRTVARFAASFAALLSFASVPSLTQAEPLKIAYSDWPGWVAWEIAIKKDWFKEEGVDVQVLWYDYVASMEAYVAGNMEVVEWQGQHYLRATAQSASMTR